MDGQSDWIAAPSCLVEGGRSRRACHDRERFESMTMTDDPTVQELLQRVERRSPASKADLDALRAFSPGVLPDDYLGPMREVRRKPRPGC
jgi:hypothetical protein